MTTSSGTCPETKDLCRLLINLLATHRLLDGLVGVVGGLGHDGECSGGVVVVLTVGVQVAEVVLQEQLVLGQSLYGLQEEMGELQISTLRKFLKFLQEN